MIRLIHSERVESNLPPVTLEYLQSFVEPGKPPTWDDVEEKMADDLAKQYAQEKGIEIDQAKKELVDACRKRIKGNATAV